jgi:hypothetical protein
MAESLFGYSVVDGCERPFTDRRPRNRDLAGFFYIGSCGWDHFLDFYERHGLGTLLWLAARAGSDNEALVILPRLGSCWSAGQIYNRHERSRNCAANVFSLRQFGAVRD